jgi:SAM-dependent methyltransferase
VAAWFEDEEFWIKNGPLMFHAGLWDEVPSVVDGILGLVYPPATPAATPATRPAGGRLLDACCGVGRHSLEFARRGWKVTGVDITEAYLEAARESAEAFGCGAEFLKADIRSFRRPGGFDLAVNLFRSFGYFADIAEDSAALGNIAASLAPGGAFVLETLGKELAARDFSEGEWFERDGWTVLTAYEVVGAWEGLRNRWILMRGDERYDRSFVLRLYSAREMAEAFREAGFASVEVYGGFTGRPYDEKAETMVVVGRVAGAPGPEG